jgi:uncharacterized protein YlxP (DUF503 family)
VTFVGILSLHLEIPGCASLKEKRSRIKPLIARLKKEFNLSVAEVDLLDAWQESIIACALVSNEPAHIQRSLQTVMDWMERNWRDVTIMDDHLELR